MKAGPLKTVTKTTHMVTDLLEYSKKRPNSQISKPRLTIYHLK